MNHYVHRFAGALRSLIAAGTVLCLAAGAAAAQQVVPGTLPGAPDPRAGGFFIGGTAAAPEAASPRVILGYAVPAEAWPSWLGRDARLELLGGAQRGAGIVLADDGLRTLAANSEAWQMSLRLATRYALGATTTFAPALGVFAGRGGQSYELALIEPDKLRGPDDPAAGRQVGAGVGAAVQQQLANGFFATVGGAIAFVRTRGGDCVDDGTVACLPLGTLDGREGEGYRAGFGLSLGYDQGPMRIGLSADVQRHAAAGEGAENAYIGGLRFNFRLN